MKVVVTGAAGFIATNLIPRLISRGDEIFGRRLTITFLRELTAEEASREARYTGDSLPEPDDAIEQLREKLDKIPFRGGARRP